jgi:hypothetical protein
MWTRTSGVTLAEGNHFDTYCIEILQDVYLGSNYTFTLGTLPDAPHPGDQVPTVGTGTGMGSVKADLISELWADHFSPTLDAADSAAFQLAIWKIIYTPATESGPQPLDLDLTTGALKALGASNGSIIGTAQTWLNGLTGLDSAPHASLVALSSDNYQDQITVACPLPATAWSAMALLGACAAAGIVKRSSLLGTRVA